MNEDCSDVRGSKQRMRTAVMPEAMSKEEEESLHLQVIILTSLTLVWGRQGYSANSPMTRCSQHKPHHSTNQRTNNQCVIS